MILANIGQFIMDHFEVLISILLGLIAAYTGLSWKHLETKFKAIKEEYMTLRKDHMELNKKLEHLAACQHDMETNYISRFSDIKQDLAENKIEIIDVIHKMETRLKDDMFRMYKAAKESGT